MGLRHRGDLFPFPQMKNDKKLPRPNQRGPHPRTVYPIGKTWTWILPKNRPQCTAVLPQPITLPQPTIQP